MKNLARPAPSRNAPMDPDGSPASVGFSVGPDEQDDLDLTGLGAADIKEAIRMFRAHQDGRAAGLAARQAADLGRAAYQQVVYAARIAPDGPIKIGTARNAEHRIAGIQVNCPYEVVLLGTMPCDQEEEHGLHKRFAAHRIRGEWFHPAPEVLAWCAQLEPATRRPSTVSTNVSLPWSIEHGANEHGPSRNRPHIGGRATRNRHGTVTTECA